VPEVDDLPAIILEILRERLGPRMVDYAFPPPVFEAMEGQFLALDLDVGTLTNRFPVRARYLNPYGAMQGGMVAAAVDNTLGPLSVLIAPPNVTRHLDMTYSRPVTLDLGYIVVTARLVAREGRTLSFRADVRSPERMRLARATALHWIVDEQDKAD
jgi:acyl-coenzyme A thioesterase PaaI-like protein